MSPVLSSSPAPAHGEDQAASQQMRETSLQTKVSALATRRSNLAGMLTALAMASVAAWAGDSLPKIGLWLLATCGPQLLALLIFGGSSAVVRSSTGTEGPSPRAALAMSVAAICSAGWGTTAWLLLPGIAKPDFVLLATATAVIFVGQSSGIVYRPILLAQALTGPLVFAWGLLHAFGTDYAMLAAGFLIIGLSSILLSSSDTEAARLALRFGDENERLLAESVSEQALAEAARHESERARQEAELADRGKTAFLAAAGHDLRQPLHALVQYHGHLQRNNHDAGLNDTVVRIGKSLDAMHDLLDAMLEVSKLMTGTIRPQIRPFRLDPVLGRLEAQLHPLAQAKGLHLSWRSEPSVLKSDDILLERILRNLALNAIRYTETGRIGIRVRRHRGQCRILVWDTGIGIAKAEHSRIFDEFYQVGNEARDARKGLGLGLAIVRQLSGLLQIRIRLRSLPQRGSVFALELPLAKEEELPEQTINPEAESDFTRGACIVLVDDNAESLEATAQTLRSFGARVLAASSSLDALGRLQSQEFAPQLLVSDYRLVGETGLDVIRVLSENQKALYGDDFEIATLLITGDTAPAELQKAQRAGILMLHKPLSAERLYQGVNERLAALAHTGSAAEQVAGTQAGANS